MNKRYGKLTDSAIKTLQIKTNNTFPLFAGCYTSKDVTDFDLNILRGLPGGATEVSVDGCFLCLNKAVETGEHECAVCSVCERVYFKSVDITDYTNYKEPSRWKLFWNRLRLKMSSISTKRK